MAITDGEWPRGAPRRLAERRQEVPGATRMKLTDEACRRLDLMAAITRVEPGGPSA